MTVNALACALGATFAVVAESALCYFAPQFLARLAFIPIGKGRTVAIPRALLDERQVESPFRSSARADLTLDRLTLPAWLLGAESVGLWEGQMWWLRADRSLAICGIRAEVRGERVHIAARVYPWPVAGLLFVPILAVAHGAGALLPVGALVAFSWLMSVLRLRGEAQDALGRIADAVGRGEPRTGQ